MAAADAWKLDQTPIIGSSPGSERGAPGHATTIRGLRAPPVFPGPPGFEAAQEQHVSVMAAWSDGSSTDVTADARFDTSNEGVATVRPSGITKTVGQGEGNILVRYQDRSALVRLTVPYGRPVPFAFDSQN